MTAQLYTFLSLEDRLLAEQLVSKTVRLLFPSPMSREIDQADATAWGIRRLKRNGFNVDNAIGDAARFMAEREARINPNKLGVA